MERQKSPCVCREDNEWILGNEGIWFPRLSQTWIREDKYRRGHVVYRTPSVDYKLLIYVISTFEHSWFTFLFEKKIYRKI